MTTADKRFTGIVATDYDLCIAAIPHYDKLQTTAAKHLALHFRNQNEVFPHIFEIGCGTGYTTRKVLEYLPNAQICAVDNEHSMIAQAISAFPHANVTYRLNDALKELGKTKENSVDGVVSAFVLHNIDKDTRAWYFTEIRRVLTPGGIFVNVDKYANPNQVEHHESLRWQVNSFIDTFSAHARTDLIKEWVDHYLLDDMPHLRLTQSEAVRAFYPNSFPYGSFTKPQFFERHHMDAVMSTVKVK